MTTIADDEGIVVETVIPPGAPSGEEVKDMEPKVDVEGGNVDEALAKGGSDDGPRDEDVPEPEVPAELDDPRTPRDPTPDDDVKVVGYNTTKSAELALAAKPLSEGKVPGRIDWSPPGKPRQPRSKEAKHGAEKGQEILKTLKFGPQVPQYSSAGVSEHEVPATGLSSSWPTSKAPPTSSGHRGKGKGKPKTRSWSTAAPSVIPHGGKSTSVHRRMDQMHEAWAKARTPSADDWMAGLPSLDNNDIEEPAGPQVFELDHLDLHVNVDHDATPVQTADSASGMSTSSVHGSRQLEDYQRQVALLAAESELLRQERDYLKTCAEDLETRVLTVQDAADKAMDERDQARMYGKQLGAKYNELKCTYDKLRAEHQSLMVQFASAQDSLRSQNAIIKSMSENQSAAARSPTRGIGVVGPQGFSRSSKEASEPTLGAVFKTNELASRELAFRPIDFGPSPSATTRGVGSVSAARMHPAGGIVPANSAGAMTKLHAIFDRMPVPPGQAPRHGQPNMLSDQPPLSHSTVLPTVEVPRRRPGVGRRAPSTYQLGSRNIIVDISDAKTLAALLTLIGLCEDSITAEAVGEFYWHLRNGQNSGLFKDLADFVRSRLRGVKLEAVVVPWITNMQGSEESFVCHQYQMLMGMPDIVSWCELSEVREAFFEPGDEEYYDEAGMGAGWDEAYDEGEDEPFCV